MITQFNLFEKYDSLNNNKITDIIRNSGFHVVHHDRIYKSTINNRVDLVSSTYEIMNEKYGDILYLDVMSFKKLDDDDDDVKNYHTQYFYYPIEKLSNLFKGINIIRYVELPFFDELREIVKLYDMDKKSTEFNI